MYAQMGNCPETVKEDLLQDLKKRGPFLMSILLNEYSLNALCFAPCLTSSRACQQANNLCVPQLSR